MLTLRNLIFTVVSGMILSHPILNYAQDFAEKFTLSQTIEAAIKANLRLQQSQDEVVAAQENQKARATEFLPTLNAKYEYIHRDKPTTQALGTQNGEIVDVLTNPDDEYNFITSFSQPIFSGFELINRYKIARLGLDAAELSKRITRQDVILDAKNAYYSILKTQKLVNVARDTVRQIAAQKEVVENMHKVDMSPLNDLLQSQVQLANARQRLVTAQNNMEIAKSQFNSLLRRPINAPVAIMEVLNYKPFVYDIDYCLTEAKTNRLEIEVAELEFQIAQKDYNLSEKDYFPSVDLIGTWTHRGTSWDADGGEGIGDSEFWDIRVAASWNFWEWGRTSYGVREKLSRLSQVKSRKEEILDNIDLEVKQAYLKTIESAKNMITIEKAIEQAKENLWITEERFKEQVSTATDVLVAQTLETETITNYYNALYDYKIAKAVLYRAIGQEELE